MKYRLFAFIVLLVLAACWIFWHLTRPHVIAASAIEKPASVNLANGETVFWAGGCASCHAPKGAKGEEKLKLGGGHALETPFGTFITPNISPDPTHGIGKWKFVDFYNAMTQGTSPDGRHYYPAFPYPAYTHMTTADLFDLFTFLRTLPAVETVNQPHQLGFLYRFRRGIGLWNLINLSGEYHLEVKSRDRQLLRGRYLVEALGHCGACHTPRNFTGGYASGKWLAGGPAAEGNGHVPNITPSATGIGSWSRQDIVYALETGFMPDYDSFGGSMVSVQENMAKLPKADLEAIATYLKAVKPVATPPPKSE